jgi:hypothetical protein
LIPACGGHIPEGVGSAAALPRVGSGARDVARLARDRP